MDTKGEVNKRQDHLNNCEKLFTQNFFLKKIVES